VPAGLECPCGDVTDLGDLGDIWFNSFGGSLGIAGGTRVVRCPVAEYLGSSLGYKWNNTTTSNERKFNKLRLRLCFPIQRVTQVLFIDKKLVKFKKNH